ncbi:MAG: transcription elongation factor GreA [Bacillota bacterium]
MENNVYQLTKEGMQELKDELEFRKTTERDRILESLKEARAQGDLSENADYDAARDDQAKNEQRIREIENILKHAEIITDDKSNKVVAIGKTVTLKINGKDPEDYNIVGSLEADPFEHKISNESPVGKAVIGHKKGETVRVRTDSGRDINIKIQEVK